MWATTFFKHKKLALDASVPFIKELSLVVSELRKKIHLEIKANEEAYKIKYNQTIERKRNKEEEIAQLPSNSREEVNQKSAAFKKLDAEYSIHFNKIKSQTNQHKEMLENDLKALDKEFGKIREKWESFNAPKWEYNTQLHRFFFDVQQINTQGPVDFQGIERLCYNKQFNLDQFNVKKEEYIRIAKSEFTELKKQAYLGLYAHYISRFFATVSGIIAVSALIAGGAPAFLVLMMGLTIIIPMMMNISAAAGGGPTFGQMAEKTCRYGVNLGGTLLLIAAVPMIISIIFAALAASYDTQTCFSKKETDGFWNVDNSTEQAANTTVSGELSIARR